VALELRYVRSCERTIALYTDTPQADTFSTTILLQLPLAQITLRKYVMCQLTIVNHITRQICEQYACSDTAGGF